MTDAFLQNFLPGLRADSVLSLLANIGNNEEYECDKNQPHNKGKPEKSGIKVPSATIAASDGGFSFGIIYIPQLCI